MRLKILVIPFSILIALILVIGYIKPDITEIQEKKVALEGKLSQVANVGTLVGNIATLSNELAEKSGDQTFVKEYIPSEMDQERVMDMFNFLASQSGVFVYVMGMKEVQVKAVAEETLQVVAGTPMITDGVLTPVPQAKPKIKAYTAQVEVRGDYENIRDFFNRLSHMNRLGKIENFSLSAREDKVEGEASTTLTGVFQAEFSYFPMQKVASALNIPVFSKAEFSSDELTALRTWAKDVVAPLEDPVTGRPNPFQ